MRLVWTNRALNDLDRLHAFLVGENPRAARDVVRKLISNVGVFAEHPQIGSRVQGFDGRDIRRMIVSHYEIRYEVLEDHIRVLSLWHTFEDR